MKKIFAWIIIVLCSTLLFIFALTMVYLYMGLLDTATSYEIEPPEIISTTAGTLALSALLIFGIRWAKKMLKGEKEIEAVEFTGTLDLKLQGRIAYADYRKLILIFTFKKPAYLLATTGSFIGALTLISSDVDYSENFPSVLAVFGFAGFFLLAPLLAIRQIKKSYESNKMFHQMLEYHLTNDFIHVKGETFESTQKWDHFFRIKEMETFFLLFSGNTVAMVLDKKMFRENDLDNFRRFISSLDIKRD